MLREPLLDGTGDGCEGLQPCPARRARVRGRSPHDGRAPATAGL